MMQSQKIPHHTFNFFCKTGFFCLLHSWDVFLRIFLLYYTRTTSCEKFKILFALKSFPLLENVHVSLNLLNLILFMALYFSKKHWALYSPFSCVLILFCIPRPARSSSISLYCPPSLPLLSFLLACAKTFWMFNHPSLSGCFWTFTSNIILGPWYFSIKSFSFLPTVHLHIVSKYFPKHPSLLNIQHILFGSSRCPLSNTWLPRHNMYHHHCIYIFLVFLILICYVTNLVHKAVSCHQVVLYAFFYTRLCHNNCYQMDKTVKYIYKWICLTFF